VNMHPDIVTTRSSASRGFQEWKRWAELFNDGDLSQAMSTTALGLHLMKARLSSEEWSAAIASPEAAALRKVAHECPYSRRGFAKPRGYAGDALLLDFIYGSAPPPEDTTERGRAILAWMRRESTGFASVRWRRDYFAQRLDDAAARVHWPRVASIACGHFREGQRSLAVRSKAFESLQVLDSDPVSLEVVTAEQHHDGVTPVLASVRDIVTGKYALTEMDFVYSAGLYDYLADRFATRLTRQLFASLRPGGSLVVANFVRMMEDGWMEAFMDWRLLYRTPEQVRLFSSEIPQEEIASQRVFSDPFSNVAYLEIVKR
jgi:extracellular factor (EF) 3-hydroxypalmitic acid methyl ester biosynthesis protein